MMRKSGLRNVTVTITCSYINISGRESTGVNTKARSFPLRWETSPADSSHPCLWLYHKLSKRGTQNAAFKRASVEAEPIRKALEHKQKLRLMYLLNNLVEEWKEKINR